VLRDRSPEYGDAQVFPDVDGRGLYRYAAGTKRKVKGARKPVRVRHGSATVTGERARRSHCTSGKAGGAGIRESGDWSFACNPDRARNPKEVVSVDRALGREFLLGSLALAWISLALFAALFDNGALLTPVLGEAAQANNYLHELFHDGRHILGTPCH
jgi:hypothetical protein